MEEQFLELIKKKEFIARKLSWSPTDRQQLTTAINEFAYQFLDNIETSPTYFADSHTGEIINEFNPGFESKPIETILPILEECLTKIALNAASGRHFGYVPGGGLYSTGLGDYMAAVTNIYAGIFYAGPGAVRVENQMIRWMCKMVGFPSGALGNLTSGGSIANLIAVITARDFHGIEGGLIPKSVVYLTDHVHHCVQKALRIAGLKSVITRYVGVDSNYRMDSRKLKEMVAEDKAAGLNPFLLVGSAGTTNLGAIDPLEDLADVAKKYDMWFHVDAAYGGFFMLVEELKPKFKGIELSDSITIDPHKGLFLSYGLGAILIKNVKALYDAHFYTASYMQDAFEDEEPSPADLSPELTKHFRGLRMWLPLHLHGIEAFKAALEEKMLLCQYFYHAIQQRGFEVGPFPQLSIIIFRYVPAQKENVNTFNKKLVNYVHQNGKVFLSTTTIDGDFWIRFASLSFRTHLKEVDACLEVLSQGLEVIKNDT